MELTSEDYAAIVNNERISDKVITAYLNLLQVRGTRSQWPTIFVYNTNFMKKVLSEKWTKKVDIFRFEMLLVPYFVENIRHWVLITIDMRTKQITVFDSIHGDHTAAIEKLTEYLSAEALNKRNEILLTKKWKLLGKAGPKQYNTVDCGVFLCITAEAYTADRTITFTQSDIPWLRGVIAEELKSGKLQSHQKPPPHIPGVKAPPVKKGRKKIVRSTSPMFVPNPSQTPTDADPPKPELQVIEIKNTEGPSPRKPMIKMEERYMEISSSEDEEEGNNAAATLELCLQEEDRLLTLKDLEEIIEEVTTGEPKHQPSNIQEELGTDWDVLSIHDSESLDLKEAEDQVNPQHRATVIQLGKPIEVLGGHTASSNRPTVIQQTSLDPREVTFSGEAGRLDEDTMTITVPNATQPRDPSSTEKTTKKRLRDRKQRTRKVKRLGKGTRKYRDRQTGSKYWKK
ncbi:SUMO1 sentrin specific peptidase 1 [Homalodisca vitripennis]|nr:SUMO1 sentrin specific peptidase 1 [Homalodisca vitripennis]